MYPLLDTTISNFYSPDTISNERKDLLQPLVDYIQKRVNQKLSININFICTHNSRRSHLSQIWAQLASAYYKIPNTFCYSGGTEETALFPKIVETLTKQGLSISVLCNGSNPIYSIKYDQNAMPVIGFSKKFDSLFNPVSEFAAIMTCSQADGGCPFISGADVRLPLTFEDPKYSDDTNGQDEVYLNKSIEIAVEMFYVFSLINTNDAT